MQNTRLLEFYYSENDVNLGSRTVILARNALYHPSNRRYRTEDNRILRRVHRYLIAFKRQILQYGRYIRSFGQRFPDHIERAVGREYDFHNTLSASSQSEYYNICELPFPRSTFLFRARCYNLFKSGNKKILR